MNLSLEKSKLYGLISALLFSLLLFLFLWFVYMPYNERPQDEGIMVSFGDYFEGSGLGEAIAGVEDFETTPTSVPQKAVEQELITQESEKSLVLPKQDEKSETQKRKEAELERQRQAEQARRAAIAAEEKRKQEAAAKSESLIGGAFGNKGAGSGTTTGDTREGNPVGSGISGGHGWSLSGRSLKGSLATPNYPSNVEGRITVNIRVDESGRVVGTSIASSSNISDAQTRKAAEDAAKRTTFTAGSGVASGTITYNFRLK